MATSRIASGITGGMRRDLAPLFGRRGGQIGDERREVGAGAGCQGLADAVLELVWIEPAGGGVRAEGLRDLLALGVRGSCLVRHAA